MHVKSPRAHSLLQGREPVRMAVWLVKWAAVVEFDPYMYKVGPGGAGPGAGPRGGKTVGVVDSGTRFLVV